MRQPKVKHVCPKCGALLKRVIGAVTRNKYWVCTEGGEPCYKSRTAP